MGSVAMSAVYNPFTRRLIDFKQESIIESTVADDEFYRIRGKRSYELTNHVGNVLAIISDRRIAVDNNTDGSTDYYDADVLTAQDYYAFGSQLEGRSYVNANWSGSYRFGFNGMEKDEEVKGNGNSLDFGARIYDPRLGRWLSLDPLMAKYPSLSPYTFVDNSPLSFIDLDGRDIIWVGTWTKKQQKTQIAMMKMQWGKAVYRQFKNSKTDDIYIGHTSAINGKEGRTRFNANSRFRDKMWYFWETPKIEYQYSTIAKGDKIFVDVFEGEKINNEDAIIHLVLVSDNALESDEYYSAGLIIHEIIVHILIPRLYGADLPPETEHEIAGGNDVGPGANNRKGSIQADINYDCDKTRKEGERKEDRSQAKLDWVKKEVDAYKAKKKK